MSRYQRIDDSDGEPIIYMHQGLPEFVYAKESCDKCYGSGLIGRIEGCYRCRGKGKVDKLDCAHCDGTGNGDEGEYYHVFCSCIKNESDFEEKE